MQFKGVSICMLLIQISFLSNCGGPEDLSASEISELSPTSKMPAGKAIYQGEIEQKYTLLSSDGMRTNEKTTADLHLAADFDANEVDVSIDNLKDTNHEKLGATLEGSASGTGFIYESYLIAETSGSYTSTYQGESASVDIDIDLEGRFRGDEAEAIDGTTEFFNYYNNSTSPGTFFATKQ